MPPKPFPPFPKFGKASANAEVANIPMGAGVASLGALAKRRRLAETLTTVTDAELAAVVHHEHTCHALVFGAPAAAGATGPVGAAAMAAPPPWFGGAVAKAVAKAVGPAVAKAIAPLRADIQIALARTYNSTKSRDADILRPLPATGAPGAPIGAALPKPYPKTLGQLRTQNATPLLAFYGLAVPPKATARDRRVILAEHLTGRSDLL